MISTPINLFTGSVSLSVVPSTFTYTLSSKPAIGGNGVMGYGNIFNFCSITGPGSANPVPVAAAMNGGLVGTAYSEPVSAQGGTGSYTYSVISGSLPAGLSLTGSTGVISGTPTTAGTASFTIQVTDGTGLVGSQAFTIVISAPSATGGTYTFHS